MVSPVSLVLSSIVFLSTVSGVNAQNLPAEGPLSISFTATQIPPAWSKTSHRTAAVLVHAGWHGSSAL
jgi:hypothetical protein